MMLLFNLDDGYYRFYMHMDDPYIGQTQNMHSGDTCGVTLSNYRYRLLTLEPKSLAVLIQRYCWRERNIVM